MFASINKNDSVTKLHPCQANNAQEVVSALAGSARIHADCQSYQQWKVKHEVKPPLYLVLQEWRDFKPEHEFRCFVFEDSLNAIGQLCWEKHIPDFEDSSLREKIIESVIKLHTSIKGELPWKNYIMDVIYDVEKNYSQVCEFNPWGPYSCTGSQIHNWELDHNILYGINQRKEGRTQPYFRRLLKGMLMIDHFDLYVPKEMGQFSAEFKDAIAEIQSRCVCCKRKARHPKVAPLPPKPTTTLVYLSK